MKNTDVFKFSSHRWYVSHLWDWRTVFWVSSFGRWRGAVRIHCSHSIDFNETCAVTCAVAHVWLWVELYWSESEKFLWFLLLLNISTQLKKLCIHSKRHSNRFHSNITSPLPFSSYAGNWVALVWIMVGPVWLLDIYCCSYLLLWFFCVLDWYFTELLIIASAGTKDWTIITSFKINWKKLYWSVTSLCSVEWMSPTAMRLKVFQRTWINS